MDELEQTAQERLEMKAIANSRALLEKIDREEKAHRSWTPALVTAAVTLLAAGAITYAFLRPEVYPQPAQPTTQMTPAEYAAYYRHRIEWHANHTRIKGKIRRQGELPQGMVILSIHVASNGAPDPIIEQSSHDSVVDADMRRLVMLGEPFGPPPTGAHGSDLAIRAKLTGRIVDGKKVLAVEAP